LGPPKLGFGKLTLLLGSNGSMMAVPAVHDVLNLHHSFLPVHQAAEKNDVKALRILVDYGADINALDVADYSSALLQAVTNKAYSALRYLLKKGANPSISPRPEGWGTPFIEAIRANDRKSISILLPYMTRVDYSPVGPDSIVRYCRSPSTLASVLGGMFELPYSVYDKQTVIFRTMLRPGFQMYMLRSHLVTQFDIHDKAVPVVYMERLMPSITEMLHVLGKWTMQALFPTEPLDYDSPLCIAAAQGLIESCRTIISLDADLNFEGHALGSALLLACAKRQFKVVKLLVRAGAKITYFSTTSNEWKSAYAFAQNSPAILQWLLVGQYTEQRKISFAPGETHCSEERIRPWSGVTQVSLPLIGERKQRHEESLFDYVVRLHEIKRAFRGKVVYYSASGSC
jgi:ankyrin repeat protein